jgi:hypothetical protein
MEDLIDLDGGEWQSVDTINKPGMDKQPDLADSNATIKPLLSSPTSAVKAQNSIDEGDGSENDSEWSMVDRLD